MTVRGSGAWGGGSGRTVRHGQRGESDSASASEVTTIPAEDLIHVNPPARGGRHRPCPPAFRRTAAMATPVPRMASGYTAVAVPSRPTTPWQGTDRGSSRPHQSRAQKKTERRKRHGTGQTGLEIREGGRKDTRDTHTNTAPVSYAAAYSAAAPATAGAAGAASAPSAVAPGPSTSTPRPRSSSDAMSRDDTMSSATLLAAARSSSTRAR